MLPVWLASWELNLERPFVSHVELVCFLTLLVSQNVKNALREDTIVVWMLGSANAKLVPSDMSLPTLVLLYVPDAKKDSTRMNWVKQRAKSVP